MNASGSTRIEMAFLDTWGPKIGPGGIAVYCVLQMYAQRGDGVVPSADTIAALTGSSEDRIGREMDKLKSFGIVGEDGGLR